MNLFSLRGKFGAMALLLGCSALVACSVSGTVQAQQPGKSVEYEVKSGLLKRSYLLYVPKSYQAGKPMPLLVALHGGYGTGKNMEEVSGFDRVADARGVIVAYPDGVSKAWNAGSCCAKPMELGVNDIAFMANLVADIKTKVAVDSKRVYGAGFSNGAMMVHRVACEQPEIFTAIASVAGGIMTPACKPARGTPTLLIQGRDDPRIPWDGGSVEESFRPSVKAVVGLLAARNGCSTDGTVSLQSGAATCTTLKGCANGNDVQWCGLSGVGHQWPGGKTLLPRLLGKNTSDYNAATQIVDFFLRHSR